MDVITTRDMDTSNSVKDGLPCDLALTKGEASVWCKRYPMHIVPMLSPEQLLLSCSSRYVSIRHLENSGTYKSRQTCSVLAWTKAFTLFLVFLIHFSLGFITYLKYCPRV
jgi:hypothetical protein